ncbi:MAG TPA: thiol reductase thioredoxin, partial [Rhodospirillaceae bacterium]|nr:thiol reductase thioredoxin [Rhodospirillaceae bacterium]
MTSIAVNDDNFEAEVINSDTPVIVDFWAEW